MLIIDVQFKSLTHVNTWAKTNHSLQWPENRRNQMRHKNWEGQNSIPEGMVRLIKTQLSHAIVNLRVHKSSFIWNFSWHEQSFLDLLVQITWSLTISHDRGWKPTVKPSNTRTPFSLHGMASSTRTLDSNGRK